MKKLHAVLALVLAILLVIAQPAAVLANEIGNYDQYQGMLSNARENQQTGEPTVAPGADDVIYTPTVETVDTGVEIYGSREEAAVTDGAANLPRNGLLKVTASAAGQWQVRVPSAEIWVDFQNETADSMNVTFAKVANLQDANGNVYIRNASIADAVLTICITEAVALPESTRLILLANESAAQPEIQAQAMPAAANYGLMLAAEVPTTYSVVINYVFTDGKQAASPYTATVAAGSDLNVTVNSPVVLGYAPAEGKESITINASNIQENITENVIYHPALVNFTVKHYQQNVNDDHYTLEDTETKTGLTKSPVGANLGESYTGFYSLLYDESVEIAADGSTVVEIYYDRYYYLMNFDLDGGYGVEPIYARYGADIEWFTPVKQGYTFAGWTPDPQGVDTMPAENRTYKASWTLHNTVPVTVVFWGENPNDEGYSYDHSGSVQATPNQNFTFSEKLQFIICGQESHTHNADCEYACGKTEHTHTAEECHYACGQNEHTHDASCLQCAHGTHDLECYDTTTFRTLKVTDAPTETLTDAGNGIYFYETTESGLLGSYQQKHYYLKIGNTWYTAYGSISGDKSDTQEITFKCSHTHTADCYKDTEHRHSDSCGYACGKEGHTHSDSCGYSCGKTEHTHSNTCYKTGAGMSSTLWTFKESDTVTVAADGSSIINVYYDRTEKTLTFKYNHRYSNGYQTTKTITKKWGADISAEYKAIADDCGNTFWSYQSNGNAPYTNYFGVMPATAEHWTYYNRGSDGSSGTMYYYGEGLAGGDLDNNDTYTVELFSVPNVGGYSVTDEDRYAFEGFTYHHGSGNGTQCSTNPKFYYSRNSYKLEFMSSGTKLEDHSKTVKYQASMKGYGDFKLPYPENLEPGAYVFDGWYSDQYFRNKFFFEKSIMPANDVMLYAKWVPVMHKVNFYLTKDTVGGTKLIDEQTVDHGAKITNVPTEFSNGGYTFVGWFYTDENGKEHAFDPNNMPVNRNLDLYGKWSAYVLVDYTLKYAVENANGTLTYIAEPTTGKALALTTKTFDAKTGDELYEDYQSGYFPKEASHSITMSADEGAENEFTFIYVPKEEVPYTVRYLEEGTEKVLHDPKTVDTRDAIVTETFVPVTGYMPDAYQKRLVLSANEDENVIIFWYVKDNTHAPLHIVHYTQNIDGDDYTVYQESTDINALINQEYSENPLTIPGFEYVEEKGQASGKMTAEGLELTLYYDRIMYPYEFRFLELGTNKVLAEPVSDFARYQAQVSQIFKSIAGYTLQDNRTKVIQIAIEEKDTLPDGSEVYVVDKNLRIFYYQENEVTINYEVVGPDGCGTVTPESEIIKAVTGNAVGSTATASSNAYKFVGWYTDEACTQLVGEDEVYVPGKTDISGIVDKDEDGNDKVDEDGKFVYLPMYESATYYAKFEYNLTSMTISKNGTAYENSDTFIFDVYQGTKKVTSVTLKMGGSVTISGLTVGETYTVKERTAGTRYTEHAELSKKLTADVNNNAVTFTNSVKENEWLTASGSVKNVFQKNGNE